MKAKISLIVSSETLSFVHAALDRACEHNMPISVTLEPEEHGTHRATTLRERIERQGKLAKPFRPEV